MTTLYELKQSLGMIGEQLKDKNNELSQKASNPNVDMESVNQLKEEKAGLQQRYDIVESQVKEIEQKEQSKFKDKTNAYQSLNEENQIIKAKAEFYRHALNPKEYSKRSEEHTSELQSRFELVCR